ncbi:MAG: PTS sugar transporter subunit IIA [Polyangiales bacterium]
MIDPELCLAGLEAKTPEDVVKALAAKLLAKGHVRESFEKAALAREKRSPTGLPFPGVAVALPHAEPEHVASPAIAVATLAKPVTFRQMGSPGTKLTVSLVVMPAFTAKEQAGAQLSSLIERLQDDALRDRLVRATDAQALADALGGLE